VTKRQEAALSVETQADAVGVLLPKGITGRTHQCIMTIIIFYSTPADPIERQPLESSVSDKIKLTPSIFYDTYSLN
jgi:hypothetical protein